MQYTKITLATVGLGFSIGMSLGMGGCRGSEPDPNHCANQDGDAACVRMHGDELPYCPPRVIEESKRSEARKLIAHLSRALDTLSRRAPQQTLRLRNRKA